jgi:hypothetical protein
MSNPSVNRYLTNKAFDHIDHALGRPVNPLAGSYRNYFATSADSVDAKAFAVSDYWERGGIDNGMAYFNVTQAGRLALRAHLESHAVTMGKPWRAYIVEFNGYRETIPARSRGQARYLRFLNISDIYPSLNFGQFCREASVRVAA